MRVLFLMFVYPDMDKSFNMYTTIVEQFVKNGHEVTVVAPAQHSEKTHISTEAGVDVLRVKTLPVKNVANWIKGLSNVLLPLQYDIALKKFFPNNSYDLIVTPTPPITLVDIASKLKRKHRAKLYLILRDIFPQNAVDLGFMKQGSLMYKYFKHKESRLYQESDYIGCMSNGNIDYVIKHNSDIQISKLHEFKNFQYTYSNLYFNRELIREKYNLQNKFVLVFGGNMGKPQQLENVLELAKRAQSRYDDVLFLLLGEGVAMKRVENRAKEDNITNLRIINSIPKQDYQDLIKSCDVGMISLHQDFTIPNIPSKSLDYWNVGLPILASIDKSTDYNKVLEQNKTGLWSYAGDHDRFFNNLCTLYEEPNLRKSMSSNGLIYFENNLTPEIAYQTIINVLNDK